GDGFASRRGAGIVHLFARRDRGKARNERVGGVLNDPSTFGVAGKIRGMGDAGRGTGASHFQSGIERSPSRLDSAGPEFLLQTSQTPARRLHDQRWSRVIPREEAFRRRFSITVDPTLNEPIGMCG